MWTGTHSQKVNKQNWKEKEKKEKTKKRIKMTWTLYTRLVVYLCMYTCLPGKCRASSPTPVTKPSAVRAFRTHLAAHVHQASTSSSSSSSSSSTTTTSAETSTSSVTVLQPMASRPSQHQPNELFSMVSSENALELFVVDFLSDLLVDNDPKGYFIFWEWYKSRVLGVQVV